MEGLCHVLILGLLVAGSSANKISKVYHGIATWYGQSNGDGSNGGACGYQNMVYENGYTRHEAAVSDVLFRYGLGCGECFKVMCYGSPLCSKKPVTVVVMDRSPGGNYVHFDLSGSAFGLMASNGSAQDMRNVGQIAIVAKRTSCKYKGKKIAFRVVTGSTDNWLSLLVLYENDDGDIASMQIKWATSKGLVYMTHVWGATWCIQSNAPLKGPFSIKLTSSSGKTLSMKNAIPRNWKVEKTYTSYANFN